MVLTRRRKSSTSSNQILKENEAAENYASEAKTFDPAPMTLEQPDSDAPCEYDVENSPKEKEEKTQEILAEQVQDPSEDEELDWLKFGILKDDKINSEDTEEDEIVEEFFSVQRESEEDSESLNDEDELEDENESEVGEEESENGDELSEEADEESEEGDGDLEVSGKEKENADVIEVKPVERIVEKVEATLKEMTDKSPKRTKKKLDGARSKKMKSGDVDKPKKVEPGDIDKPKPSRKRKSTNRVETMGMIFMCSSTTKKDCFRYRVLGLPASKRDVVEKIYTGMRLFLYDVDLKLLNGIYKAVGPGGYNIEPKAFNSQFPSQVRFTVLDDCLPLEEKKFKKVIKDNYFTNNKFDGLLTSEQVKKLCGLFNASGKVFPRRFGRRNKVEGCRIVLRDRLRKQRADEERWLSVREERRRPRKRPRKVVTSVVPVPSAAPSHAYDSSLAVDDYRRHPNLGNHGPHREPILLRDDRYRVRRDPRVEHFDSYRDGRTQRDYYSDGLVPPPELRSPYRDGRQRRSPYLDGRHRRSPYLDGRHRRSPYLDGRDHHVEWRSPYRLPVEQRSPYRLPVERRSLYGDGRDLAAEHRDPYRVGRDTYAERRSPYRNGHNDYIDTHNSYSDVRDSYMHRHYRDAPQSETYESYRRVPISDRQDVYGDELLSGAHGSYGRLQGLQPTLVETRRVPETSRRDPYDSYRPAYTEPAHSVEYSTRSGLERDYRPAGPTTDLYSTRSRLPEYFSRRALD